MTGSRERNVYRCGTNHAGGERACTNDRTVRRDLAEELLIEPVKQEVLAPDAVEYAVRQMRRLWVEHQTEPEIDRGPEVARLEATIQEVERLLQAGVLSSSIEGAALDKARGELAAALRAQQRVPVSAATDVLFQAEQLYRETAGRLLGLPRVSDVVGGAGAAVPAASGGIPCRPAELGKHLIAEVVFDHVALIREGPMDELVAGA